MPEELRRYYLDVMGIQAWEDLDAQPTPDEHVPDAQAAAAVTETVAAATVAAVKAEPVSEPAQAVAEEPQTTKTETSDVAQSDWAELNTIVEQCQRCDLNRTRRQTVFGVGNQHANLLVIGEAPGQDEDAQGEPFVGEAGQLLTAMLKAINLPREEVYITNVLKCHTPDNRDPLAVEIENCNTYLRRQIALLQPKAIYAVGRVAAQALLNSKESISKLRKHQHSFEGIPLIASYHPAYLLRKPSEKRTAWHDLQQLQRLLAE